MLSPFTDLAPFFGIQVDVEALNYQVEERKLQKPIEQNNDMAYGKLPRLGPEEGVEQRKFCL